MLQATDIEPCHKSQSNEQSNNQSSEMKSRLINTDAQLGEEHKHTRTVDLILMQPHTRMNKPMQKHTE